MENLQLENGNVGDNKTVVQNEGTIETIAVVTAPTISSSPQHEDDLTAVQEGSARDAGGCYVPACGLVYYVMNFLGLFCVYTQRVSLSVTIVAMVNHTALADQVRVVLL